jgi:K+-sensing histidine kinase KdpD
LPLRIGLTYSRLERSGVARERIMMRVVELVGAIEQRLRQRASQSGMELVVELPEGIATTELDTDPASVEQILFNIVDNASKYASSASDKRIHLNIAIATRLVIFVVADHGPGLDKAIRRKFFQPFSKSAEQAARSSPGVGLGMALSLRLARKLRGDLQVVDSSWNHGCAIKLTLPVRDSY